MFNEVHTAFKIVQGMGTVFIIVKGIGRYGFYHNLVFNEVHAAFNIVQGVSTVFINVQVYTYGLIIIVLSWFSV